MTNSNPLPWESKSLPSFILLSNKWWIQEISSNGVHFLVFLNSVTNQFFWAYILTVLWMFDDFLWNFIKAFQLTQEHPDKFYFIFG